MALLAVAGLACSHRRDSPGTAVDPALLLPDGDPPPAVALLDASAREEAAQYEAWIEACLGWMRSDCRKSVSCGIQPASDCGKSDDQLRALCVAGADQDGCRRPDPQDYTRCQARVDGQSCEEFCKPGSMFCFDFCFYVCLDGRPRVPDAGLPSDSAGAD